MYRRGWYQVMGGEVGFCGPVCATFRVFCPSLLCPVVRRQLLPVREICDGLIGSIAHGIAGQAGQDASFFGRAGL
jgi:hypothetical protein